MLTEHSSIEPFLAGKSAHTLELYRHFVETFDLLANGKITLEATKAMIAVDNGKKRVAWITQLGRNFIHVVFPLKEPFYDNLCFQKVGPVSGNQFNHHFRMLAKEDLNDEVKRFMLIALE